MQLAADRAMKRQTACSFQQNRGTRAALLIILTLIISSLSGQAFLSSSAPQRHLRKTTSSSILLSSHAPMNSNDTEPITSISTVDRNVPIDASLGNSANMVSEFHSEAYKHYLQTMEKLQTKRLKLENDEETNQVVVSINSLVFEIIGPSNDEKECSYVLAVLSDQNRVDEAALQQLLGLGEDSTVQLAAPDRVQSLCGFSPGTVPPVGHWPIPPRWTFVEASLLARSDANTVTVLKGGGGLADQSCHITLETLLQQHSVVIANFQRQLISAPTDEMQDHPMTESHSSTPQTFSATTAPVTKPFFPVTPLPQPMAQTVWDQLLRQSSIEAELSSSSVTPEWQPPLPTAVTVTGRLSSVRSMSSRLVFSTLVPLSMWPVDGDDNGRDDSVEQDFSMESPWKSPGTLTDMAVQLIAGKTLCATMGQSSLKGWRPGQWIMVQGLIRWDSRTSLENWIQHGRLDVTVVSYQWLQPQQQRPSIVSPDPPTKSKGSPFTKTTSAADNQDYLRLDELYPDNQPADVQVVSDLDSVLSFQKDIQQLEQNLNNPQKNEQASFALVGLDCEWKPFAYLETGGEAQPVLLLQICLHPLRRIYLFDLQTMLRPMLPRGTEPTPLELAVSNSLKELLASSQFFKTGYQVSQDLRLLCASYPHIPGLAEVNSVLELSSLAKTVMRLARLPHSKKVTSSLSRVTNRFLGKPLNKQEQVSDWSARPLTQAQKEYAAMDAAVTPAVVEKVLTLIDGLHFFNHPPQVGRQRNDGPFRASVHSWRYHFLTPPEQLQGKEARPLLERLLRKVGARSLMGNYLVAQNWVTGASPPQMPSLPNATADGVVQEEGPFVDARGTFRIPSQHVRVDHSNVDALLGQRVAKSKDGVVEVLIEPPSVSDWPQDAKVDFPPRSGYVELENAVALFVNIPQASSSRRVYPNEWREEGRILTWFLRENDWDNGNSQLAQKLADQTSCSVLLFVRLGSGQFFSCGRCAVSVPKDDEEVIGDKTNIGWRLIELHLHLLDWKQISSSLDFRQCTAAESLAGR